MKRNKILAFFAAAVMAAGVLSGCGGNAGSSLPGDSSIAGNSSDVSAEISSEPSSVPESSKEDNPIPDVAMSIAGLKGPTGLGMLKMMADSASADVSPYTFTLAGAAEEVVSKISTGELDIASVPSNLAATLWNKTGGGVKVLGVNALGVLYLVTKGEDVKSLADLKGKTIISSGKGTTAQYVFEYLLKQNGIDPEADVTIDYKTEHADAAAAIASAETAVAVLPQPFVTTVTMQDPDVSIALDLSAEWEKATSKKLPMGVIIGRTEYVEANPEAVSAFLDQYAASAQYANENPAEAAALSEEYGLIKAAVAEKAIPYCNIVCLEGDEMKAALGDFLQVLFDYNPQTIGGTIPSEDFYYTR